MASSSSSTTGPVQRNKIIRVDAEGNVYCYHDMVVVKKMATSKSSREGQEFFGCPLWPKLDCRFFVWKNELEKRGNDGVHTKMLEMKNKALQLKISNTELEKMLLELENEKLELKLAMTTYPIIQCVTMGVVVVAVLYLLI